MFCFDIWCAIAPERLKTNYPIVFVSIILSEMPTQPKRHSIFLWTIVKVILYWPKVGALASLKIQNMIKSIPWPIWPSHETCENLWHASPHDELVSLSLIKNKDPSFYCLDQRLWHMASMDQPLYLMRREVFKLNTKCSPQEQMT